MEPLKKDGIILAVLRPKDPILAVKLGKSILGRKDGEVAMQEVLAAQEYRFVGLASHDGKFLLDPETFVSVGPIVSGDSFVSWDGPNGIKDRG